MSKWMLTDKEMAQVKDIDLCSEIIEGFGDCPVCSVKCHEIATAQAKKLLEYLIAHGHEQSDGMTPNKIIYKTELRRMLGELK